MRKGFVTTLLLFCVLTQLQGTANAVEFFPSTWMESILGRFSWARTSVGSAILERAIGKAAAETVATEGEINRASREVEADLNEFREQGGRSVALRSGEPLLPDEAQLVRDSSEEAFHVRLDEGATFTATRAAFLEGALSPVTAVEDFAIPAGKAKLRGVRYPREGGKPIVLGHGIIESSRIWREIARRLSILGYDVWVPNWRGHGRVSHRSLVAAYESGDYGFRHMVNEDLPALLNRIHEVTGQKAVLVGHSMGGMIERAASAELVSARIEVGSPRGFDEVPRVLKILARASEPVLSRALYNVDLTFEDVGGPATAGAKNRLREGLKKLFRGVVDPLLAKALPDGFLNADNVTELEFTALRESTISDLNADIANDFIRMVNSRKAWLSGLPVPSDADTAIPTLVVVGELDMMAPAEPILNDLRLRKAGSPVWTVRMGRAGHMDLVVGQKAADRLVPLIHEFAQNPANLGPPGSHREIK